MTGTEQASATSMPARLTLPLREAARSDHEPNKPGLQGGHGHDRGQHAGNATADRAFWRHTNAPMLRRCGN